MTINFANIHNQVVEMADFDLKWRFTEEKYDVLPAIHLNQITPLNEEAANYLDQYIRSVELHADQPFKKNLFKTIEHINVSDGNEKEIKKWLYQRGLPFEKKVFLSWNRKNGAIVPWKILIKYFDSFYYPGSDDLTVIDESLNWAIVFAHWDTIYFGTNENFKRTEKTVNLKDF